MTTKISKLILTEDTSANPNSKYKSSVFSLLFSKPDILRELYSAIEDVTLPPDIPVDINTLSNALFKGKLNDISFMIDNRLVVLIEHQSSINENMPLRLLMYISDLYKIIIDRRKIHQKTLVKIPKPEFIVLYNGSDSYPEYKELRLSYAFKDIQGLKGAKNGNLPLELTVHVYNINLGNNNELLKKCETLGNYSYFVDKIREYQKSGLDIAEAMKSGVKYCIDNNILKDFLETHGTEVVNMLYEEFNLDEALDVRYEEGLELGRAEERKEVLKLLEQGLSTEEIKRYLTEKHD